MSNGNGIPTAEITPKSRVSFQLAAAFTAAGSLIVATATAAVFATRISIDLENMHATQKVLGEDIQKIRIQMEQQTLTKGEAKAQWDLFFASNPDLKKPQ